MVQKSDNELEVNSKPAYMYYLMTKSGQCSPTTSDTLDSGTGSDLETNSNHGNGTPPSITAVAKSIQKFTIHDPADRVKLPNRSVRTNENYHTDSEESESSLSCDSLNSGDSDRIKGNSPSPNGSVATSAIASSPFLLQSQLVQSQNSMGNSSNRIFTSDENNITKISFLPHSLLRDIRDRSAIPNTILNGIDEYDNATAPNDIAKSQQKTNGDRNVEKRSAIKPMDKNSEVTAIKHYALKKCSFGRNDMVFSETKCYENDKYINFHINECVLDVIKENPSKDLISEDDTFAGYRDIRAPTAASTTIRSSKGTIRGVKNRVRNGIATFLQMHQTNVKVSPFNTP